MLSIDFCNIDAADIRHLNRLASTYELPKLAKEALTLDRVREYRKAQLGLRLFFEPCAEGSPDIGVLQQLLGWFTRLNQESRFVPGEDPFHPILTIPNPPMDVVECAFLEVVTTFINGNGERFRNVRICPFCGKVFIGGNSKAVFCNQSHGAMYRRGEGKPYDQEPLDRETLIKYGQAVYGIDLLDMKEKSR